MNQLKSPIAVTNYPIRLNPINYTRPVELPCKHEYVGAKTANKRHCISEGNRKRINVSN